MSFSLQTKALLFIFLIAGHEAARIHTVQKTLSRGPASTEWQRENANCDWVTGSWACVGYVQRDEGNGNACSFRYLPLDGLPPVSSEACRLTDKYMLEKDRAKYFQLQARLLAEKSEKFAANCKDASSMNLKCTRRAKHMFRAFEFMTKAQDESLIQELSEEEKSADRALMEESLSHMTAFAGDDAQFVLMLKDKMVANKASVRQSPKESIEQVLQLLTMLLKGTPEEQEEAREAIKAIEMSPPSSQSQDEESLDGEHALAEQIELGKDELHRELEAKAGDLDSRVEMPQNSTETSALIERHLESLQSLGNDVMVVKGIAFVVLVCLVVAAIIWVVAEILAVIVAWAFLAILGCGAYSAGNNAAVARIAPGDMGKRAERIGVMGTMKCIGNVFVMPFVAVYGAGKAVYRFFWPKKDQDGQPSSNLQQIQQFRLMEKQLPGAR